MTQATRRLVHRQGAKPKQYRSYAQESFLEVKSLKGSNCLPKQCKAALSHVIFSALSMSSSTSPGLSVEGYFFRFFIEFF
jgi:hypothetical protein